MFSKAKVTEIYCMADGDRKTKKTIHKTTKLANYQAVVSNLLAAYES